NKEGYATFDGKEHDAKKPDSNDVSAANPIVPTTGQNYCNNTNPISTAGPIVPAAGHNYSNITNPISADAADFNNLETSITVSPISTTRTHNVHPISQIIGNLSSTTQTSIMTRVIRDQGGISQILNEDFHTCMFACFLSQEEAKKVHQALKDPSWIEAMQEELLQNKKDERGIVVRNKGRLVAQGHTQEEGIDYEDVFAPVVRIEAIRLFLAYASFMGFMVYQMDVKSAFLYGTIEEEVYVCQPPGFEDSVHPDKVYKVVKALYGLHQAHRAWYETLAHYLLKNGFHRGQIDQTLFIKKQKGDILLMSSIGELTFFLGLQVKKKEDRIFINQDKYVAEILKKFGLTEGKSASTPIDTKKPLLKDPDGEDVDVHIYRSVIGSLMYLTSSRPDIIFAVCACARFQVTLKVSHLHVVKRIFRYLKGKPNLGLWYLKDSPFDLVAYSDSDYADASLDRKSTTGGCKFLGSRLTFWQCKKQIVVATSSTEAEYVAGASCYAQVIWIQNQMLDYGRVGKGCSGVETPLFEGMLVAREPEEQGDVEEQGNEEEHGNADTIAEEPKTAVLEDVGNDQPITSPTPLTLPPQQPQDVPSTSHAQSPPLQPHSPTPAQTQGANFPMSLLQEALDACAALARRVEHLEHDKVAQDLEIIKLNTRVKKLEKINKAKTLKLRRLRKVGTSQRVDTSDDALMEDVSNQGRIINRDEDAVKEEDEVREYTADTQVKGRQADIYNIDMDYAAKVLINAAAVIPSAVPETISAAATVPTVIAPPVKVAAPVKAATRQKRGVVIWDPEKEPSAKTPTKTTSKDRGKGILVEEPKPMKKKQQVELDEAYKRPQTEAQARRNMIMYLKNTAGFRLDYFKWMNYDDIRPIFVAKYNENMEFLLKSKEQMEEEESRAIALINQNSAQKAAKRRKLIEEAKEAESIKQHLQIVPDEDNDVFTEATPLARKIPVVDYQVILVNNKPRYKIIKADDTHQFFGVDAAMELKEKHQVFTTANEDISAARHKLMLLDTAAD
nr:hypothetical protein [Tanacetum cinerariifolium]